MNHAHMVRWSWRPDEDGENKRAVRSPRRLNLQPQQQQHQQHQQQQQQQQQQPSETSIDESVLTTVRNQSLFLDMEQWSMPLSDGMVGAVQPDYGLSQKENKREDSYSRIAEREMLPHVTQNPFLTDHSFVDDLQVQSTYMNQKL